MATDFNFSGWFDVSVGCPVNLKMRLKSWLEDNNIVDPASLSALDTKRIPDSLCSADEKKNIITSINCALEASRIMQEAGHGHGGAPSGGDTKWSRLPVEERIARASQLKQEGNAQFQSKDYARARETYARAIEALTLKKMAAAAVSETQSADIRALRISLYSNSAQVHLKLEQWSSAINAASVVLEYEPSNVKAIYRRALGYAHCGRLDDARGELSRVLELDPANAAARKELQEVGRSIRESRSKEKAVYSNIFSRGVGVYDDREEERLSRRREQDLGAQEQEAWVRSNAVRMSRGLSEQSVEEWRLASRSDGTCDEDSEREGGDSDEEQQQADRSRSAQQATASVAKREKARRKRGKGMGAGTGAEADAGRGLEQFFRAGDGQQIDSVALLQSLQQTHGLGADPGAPTSVKGSGGKEQEKEEGRRPLPLSLGPATGAPGASPKPSANSLSVITTIAMGGGPAARPPPRDPRRPGKQPDMSRLSLLMVDAVSTLPAVDTTDPAALSECLRCVQAGVEDIRSAACMEGVDAHLSSVTGKIKTILRLEQTLVTAPITGPPKGSGGAREVVVAGRKAAPVPAMVGPTFNYCIECEFELSMRPLLSSIGNEAALYRLEEEDMSVVSMRSIIEEDAKAVKQKNGKPPAHKPLFAVKPGTSEVTKAPSDPVPLLKGPETPEDPATAALKGVVRRYRGVISFTTSLIADCVAEGNPNYVPINCQVACTKVAVRHYKKIENSQVEMRLNDAIRLMERKIINKMIEYDHVCRHI